MNDGLGRRRLISRGQVPHSRGGIYNPGAVCDGQSILLLCRREIDYTFTPVVFPEVVLLDADSLAIQGHYTLRKPGALHDVRTEDFRLIDFGGRRLVLHTVVTRSFIKPMISCIGDGALELIDRLDLPIPTNRVEKNWVLFEHEGRLHCLYQLDPLTIFVKSPTDAWTLVKEEENSWSSRYPAMISNSTNLIPFDGGYLGFWHTLVGGRYVQGAFHLNRELSITAVTDVLLDGAEVRDGFKPGVLYVSSLVEHAGRILAFYGEGDSHTGVAIFDADALARTLCQSPFHARRRLRVAYEGATLSDLFRAANVLQLFCEERGYPPIRLYIRDATAETAKHLLRARNVTLSAFRDDHVYDGHLLGSSGRLVWNR